MMKNFTFKKGIHPPDSKMSTNNKSIQIITPPIGCEMIYPLLQHIGVACETTVEKGERVLLGQKIADSPAFLSAPIHSSVSGIVKEFRNVLTASGDFCLAVVIENDGLDEQAEELPMQEQNTNESDKDSQYTKEEYLKIIREAGIVGLGGAGFPTHAKLNPPSEKKIDYILVNAAECEPYLTTDHRILLEKPEQVIGGLEIILSIHTTAKGIIAIEENKANAIKLLTESTKNISNIEVISLVTKYPQGSEKQLIQACTNRIVPSNSLPSDVGCIVNNVHTVSSIYEAFHHKKPLVQKIMTISGDSIQHCGNYEVRIGMNLSLLLDIIGGLKEHNTTKASTTKEFIIAGGPMMGTAMFTLDIPLTKTTSSILAFTKDSSEMLEEQNCIRCGKCVKHCPISLMPLELDKNAIQQAFILFKKNGGLDCIECGSCSYVCPAKRHLTQSIRSAKKRLKGEISK